MHGSSSVPQDWLQVINENGGEIPETYGVPWKKFRKNQAWCSKGQHRHGPASGFNRIDTSFLGANRAEFDLRKYLAESQRAMRDIVIARYEAFGTAGNVF